MKRAALTLGLLVVLSFPFWKEGASAEPEPYQWGMTLEELNRVHSGIETGDTLLKEDAQRAKVNLPYNPLKSIPTTAGVVTSVIQMKKTDGPWDRATVRLSL